MVGDPLGDFINRLKTAVAVEKGKVAVPYSKVKEAVAKILKNEGFISSFGVKGKETKKILEINLSYDGGKSKITDARRISKPSRRIYFGYKEIKPVKFGHGLLILSTPKGILSGKKAKEEKVGGEALFEIW